MRTRLLLGMAAATAAVVVVLLGGVLRETGPAASTAAGPTELSALRTARDTVGSIRSLQEALRARPDDLESLTALGAAYQQRYRESADPTDRKSVV